MRYYNKLLDNDEKAMLAYEYLVSIGFTPGDYLKYYISQNDKNILNKYIPVVGVSHCMRCKEDLIQLNSSGICDKCESKNDKAV